MQALPSAFFHQVSSASRIFVPFGWMAKSTIVVVPPKAAARVPVSKSSADVVPPKGMSRCVCASMPPGKISKPDASTMVWPTGERPARTSLMSLPSIRTSAGESLLRRDHRAVFESECFLSSCRCISQASRSPTFRLVGLRSMVMQFSTGQTSEHRLQPTHSVSSTRGMRARGRPLRRTAAHPAWGSA